jgi:hypothetical protein
MSEVQLLARDYINPLSDADKALLQEILRNSHLISDLIARAEQCGIPVQAHRDKHEAHVAIAKRLDAHFNPRELPAVQE